MIRGNLTKEDGFLILQPIKKKSRGRLRYFRKQNHHGKKMKKGEGQIIQDKHEFWGRNFRE